MFRFRGPRPHFFGAEILAFDLHLGTALGLQGVIKSQCLIFDYDILNRGAFDAWHDHNVRKLPADQEPEFIPSTNSLSTAMNISVGQQVLQDEVMIELE